MTHTAATAGRMPALPDRVRLVIGALLVGAAAYWARTDGALRLAAALWLAWGIAVALTDKYEHKYPRRYVPYLLASHGKAAVIMLIVALPAAFVFGALEQPPAFFAAIAAFVASDFFVSLPSVRRPAPAAAQAALSPVALEPDPPVDPIDTAAVWRAAREWVDSAVIDVFAAKVEPGASGLRAVRRVANADDARAIAPGSAAAVVSALRLNDVRAADGFLAACARALPFGGYLILPYVPMTRAAEGLEGARYLAHFAIHRMWPKIPGFNGVYDVVTRGRGRVMSKVEVWGRLSYAGFRVVAEHEAGGDTYALAQRVSRPATNRRPSYYPIVPLEKVGLDGGTIRLHKVRSMYPYSEFLQKRMFEDHGLSSTGKFANDFRLTEYGPFLRRYWLDEVPQIVDWLRGDVKLVGMRATSRHYLSLYPAELIELYLCTKPGLVPPIFDEKTPGFDKIVETELRYLRAYQEAPVRTDIRYLFKTVADILLRGVRSK